RDNAGNVSPFSAAMCSAIPLDDPSGAPAGGFTQLSGQAGYFQSTISRATAANATLTVPSGTARLIGLLVSKGPGYGTINVTFAGTNLGNVSLDNATALKQQVVTFPQLAANATGTLVVKVVSPGVKVEVDGYGEFRLNS